MLFRKIALVTALAFLLSAQVASSEDGVMYVEGHVFDAVTLRPVVGVQLSALAPLDSACTPEGGCPAIARSATDQNGFFQLRVRDADTLRSESILVQALCVVANGDAEPVVARAGSAEARPVEAGRILRRDIYLQRPRHFDRRTACDPSLVPPPATVPVITPPPDHLPR